MENDMKKGGLKKFLAAFMLCVLTLQTTVFADVDKLNISQITQEGNDVYLYVNALDGAEKPVGEAFAAEQFSVNIDQGQAIPVMDSAVSQTLNEGVSYIFCIDISKSVTEQEMGEIRASISNFINGMAPGDYARIITIGTEITSVCDSTQDRNALNNAVGQIARTADYTYLYKGISYALSGQRKNVETMPERAAILLFTDGMDDSDGSSGEEQVLVDIAETRIPIYVVGLKGNDKSANLNAVGQIARQSGGTIYSYSSMSITDAVQTIGDVMRNTVKLHVQPETSYFGSKDLVWNAVYNAGGYTVSSKKYVYSLGLDQVVISTPTAVPEPTIEPATPTPEPEPEPTEEPEPEAEDEETVIEKITDFVKDNVIICAAAGLVLVALVMILIILIQRKRKRTDEDDIEPFPYDGQTVSSDYTAEETLADDFDGDEDETVDEWSFEDMEETIDGTKDSGVCLEFEITFDGRTETLERILKEELVLGRGNACDVDVVLHSTSEERRQTSRTHAVILNRPDGLYVKDNSKNKTYLNGVEVVGEIALRDEDVLQLGKATVKVRVRN